MGLEDPIVGYDAESNMDAQNALHFLENQGVVAMVVEDDAALIGNLLGGQLSKPQVWINRCDLDRVALLMHEYESLKKNRDAKSTESKPEKILVKCEECGQSSTFADSLLGTVQECSHCRSYVDVGEIDWPYDDQLDLDVDGDDAR